MPYSVRNKVKDAFEKIEIVSIITKQIEPTDWVNNLVIVKKSDGNLRLCLDPQELNKWLAREHFLLPTPEEILNQLRGENCSLVGI